MKKHRLRGLLLGFSMVLVLFGPALAQDIDPSCPVGCPAPPEAGPELFVTSVDNENNDGTGVADIPEPDMGYPVDWSEICGSDPIEPIEFNIAVPFEPCGAVLSIAACFVENPPEQVALSLNGHYVATLPDSPDTENCDIVAYEVPAAWVEDGNNLVQVAMAADGDCVNIGWGALEVEPCPEEVEEEFVPEPGTIVLFGSGLVGLAGYATLRWRTKE